MNIFSRLRNTKNRYFGILEQYFLWFCFMIIIPSIIIASIIYSFSIKAMSEQDNKANARMLNVMSKMVDQRIMEVENIIFDLSRDSNVQILTMNGDVYSKTSIMNIYSLTMDRINNILSTNNYIDDIYIILDDFNSVVSGKGGNFPVELFFDKINRYKDINKNQVLSMLRNPNEQFSQKQNGFYSIFRTMEIQEIDSLAAEDFLTSNNIITIVARIPLRLKKRASLVINIKESILFESVKEDTNFNGDIIVFNEWNEIISSVDKNINSSPEDMELIKFINSMENEYATIDRNGVSTQVTTVRSVHTGWTYAVLVPSSEIYSKLDYIKYIFMISIIVFLFIGILLSFLFSRKFYSPIHNIMSNLEPYSIQDESKYNEFGVINETLKNIIDEKNNVMNMYNDTKKVLMDRFFYRLIKGYTVDNNEIKKSLLDMDKNGIGSYCVPIAIEVYYLRWYDLNVTQKEKNLFALKLKVDLNALFEQKGILVEVGDKQYCGILFMNEYNEKIILNILNLILKNIRSNYHQYLDFTFAVSDKRIALQELNGEYNELRTLINNRIFGDKYQLLVKNKNDIGISENEYIPVVDARQLENALISGDYKYCFKWLNNYIEKSLENQCRQKYVKIFLVDILNTVFRVIENQGCSPNDVFENYYLLYEQIKQCNTEEEIKEYFNTIFMNTIAFIEDNQKEHEDQSIKNIIKYIENHYNEQLSLNQLAETINMTPSYFSKYFKNKVGENFIDYLNQIRINNAKSLLVKGKMKIKDIAQEVGFISSNTFNVTFKKYEGTTPGIYRKISSDGH